MEDPPLAQLLLVALMRVPSVVDEPRRAAHFALSVHQHVRAASAPVVARHINLSDEEDLTELLLSPRQRGTPTSVQRRAGEQSGSRVGKLWGIAHAADYIYCTTFRPVLRSFSTTTLPR